MVKQNPLLSARSKISKNKSLQIAAQKKIATAKPSSPKLNDKEQSVKEQMANEISEQPLLEDDGQPQMSKGARLRLEKKLKEAEEHKKRMAALKAKKAAGATTSSRPKFDRSKLGAGFMTNAKKAKDEV